MLTPFAQDFYYIEVAAGQVASNWAQDCCNVWDYEHLIHCLLSQMPTQK